MSSTQRPKFLPFLNHLRDTKIMTPFSSSLLLYTKEEQSKYLLTRATSDKRDLQATKYSERQVAKGYLGRYGIVKRVRAKHL